MRFPGFIDLQVNGFKGIDFCNPNLSLDDIKFVNRELLKVGTIGYCPTLISSSLEVYKRNLSILSRGCQLKAGAKILGIHLEGPFISPEDGNRGIHSKQHILEPSIELFEQFKAWSQNNIALLTIDPSLPDALELIEHVVGTSETIISIGHFNANPEIIKRAVDSGVRCATHVGNGIKSQIHRYKNPLWAILSEDSISGLFITDGFHIPRELIVVGLRAKTPSRFIVASDSVFICGMSPGIYDFHGTSVVLDSNGYLHVQDSEYLAGSASTMLDCMNYLATLGELGPEDLLRVGFDNALELLNIEKSSLPTKRASLITLQDNRFYL